MPGRCARSSRSRAALHADRDLISGVNAGRPLRGRPTPFRSYCAPPPYLRAGSPFKRRARVADQRALRADGRARMTTLERHKSVGRPLSPGIEAVRSTIIKLLKRGTVLLAVVALTLLVVRAWDSQRGPPLRP